MDSTGELRTAYMLGSVETVLDYIVRGGCHSSAPEGFFPVDMMLQFYFFIIFTEERDLDVYIMLD